MGCGGGDRYPRLSITFLFLLVSTLTPESFMIAQARTSTSKLVVDIPQAQKGKGDDMAAEAAGRVLIGSRPPRCERRCSSCGPCKAVQVPVVPKLRTTASTTHQNTRITYSRSDEVANYKPLSWKCKCGNLIFNP